MLNFQQHHQGTTLVLLLILLAPTRLHMSTDSTVLSISSCSTNNYGISFSCKNPESQYFKQKSLSSDSRNDIVRTLVSMIMSKVTAKPTRGHRKQVARDLILKISHIGDGYVRCMHSHSLQCNLYYPHITFTVEKMVERIKNVNKADKKKSIDLNDELEKTAPPKLKRKLCIQNLFNRLSFIFHKAPPHWESAFH